MADEDTHVRVQASKLPDDVIEQPLGTLCADDIVCPVTARTRSPSPMQLFLTQLKRVHLDPQLTKRDRPYKAPNKAYWSVGGGSMYSSEMNSEPFGQ